MCVAYVCRNVIQQEYSRNITEDTQKRPKRGCKTSMSDGYVGLFLPTAIIHLPKEQMKDDLITRLDTVNTANRLVDLEIGL